MLVMLCEAVVAVVASAIVGVSDVVRSSSAC